MKFTHGRLRQFLAWSFLILLIFGNSLHAAETAQPQTPPAIHTVNSGDNAWLLASSALVLMMTAPGLILFYGGLVRTKNVLSTMMHSLILMAVVSTLWMIFGYSMAFAPGNSFFGNPLTYLFLKNVGAAPNVAYAATIPHETFML
ncbi:MAG: ammonium transporter, partial [Limisphaerales bacterium]